MFGRVSAVLAATIVAIAMAASAHAQSGNNQPVIKPPGNGPIRTGQHSIIDAVVEANGWGSCIRPFEDGYACSPDSTFYSKRKKN